MAIEWGFLILLAVVAAVADLRPAYIILVMAVGWILVVLVELLSWRARPRYVVTEEGPAAMPMAAAPVAPPEPARLPPLAPGAVVEAAPPLPVEALPPVETQPPVESETAVGPPAYEFQFAPPEAKPGEETLVGSAGEAKRALDPDDPYAPAPERARLVEAEQRVSYRLEPLKPRPRRKYRFFGPYEREPAPAEKPTGEEQ
jgi:hypothetical protein